jgi:hypothetical protein
MTKTTVLCYVLLGLMTFFYLGINSISAQPATPNPYEGCCGLEPVVFTVGVGSVYVPNVITPNDDGFNDIFCPFPNEKIAAVTGFQILGAASLEVIYQSQDFTITYPSNEIEVQRSYWDCKTIDGQPHKGPFKYRMTVQDVTGVITVIEGMACSVVCDTDAMMLKDNPNCHYSSQRTIDSGNFDGSFPSDEKNCFSQN